MLSVLTGASLASAFAWASQNPMGFAKSTLGDCEGRRPDRSPATIDLMPARGFVAYCAQPAPPVPFPLPPVPLAAQGSIGPNNPRLVLPSCRAPPFRFHHLATITFIAEAVQLDLEGPGRLSLT
jgi:hypothetical protein